MTIYDAGKDPYPTADPSPMTFGSRSVTVTPSDTVDFTSYPKAIVATATGNLVVVPLRGTDDAGGRVTFTGIPAGYIPPFRVRRVHSTGTTATVATVED